jgi:hypothetical protein
MWRGPTKRDRDLAAAAIECQSCIRQAEWHTPLEQRYRKIVEASERWSETLEPYSPGVSLKVALVDAAWLVMEDAQRHGRGDIASRCLHIIERVNPARFGESLLRSKREELRT